MKYCLVYRVCQISAKLFCKKFSSSLTRRNIKELTEKRFIVQAVHRNNHTRSNQRITCLKSVLTGSISTCPEKCARTKEISPKYSPSFQHFKGFESFSGFFFQKYVQKLAFLKLPTFN